jgi:hypothetical protein
LCRVVSNAALLHSVWVFLNLCDARSDNTADTGAGQFNAGAAHLLPHWKRVWLWQRAAAMTGPLKGCSRSRRVGCRYSRDADLRQQMPPAGLLVPGGLGMHSAWRGAMTLRSGSKSHRLRKTPPSARRPGVSRRPVGTERGSLLIPVPPRLAAASDGRTVRYLVEFAAVRAINHDQFRVAAARIHDPRLHRRRPEGGEQRLIHRADPPASGHRDQKLRNPREHARHHVSGPDAARLQHISEARRLPVALTVIGMLRDTRTERRTSTVAPVAQRRAVLNAASMAARRFAASRSRWPLRKTVSLWRSMSHWRTDMTPKPSSQCCGNSPMAVSKARCRVVANRGTGDESRYAEGNRASSKR